MIKPKAISICVIIISVLSRHTSKNDIQGGTSGNEILNHKHSIFKPIFKPAKDTVDKKSINC